jgi:dTDP-4-dehydrorhamnose reductase
VSIDKVIVLGSAGMLGTQFVRGLGQRAVPVEHQNLDLGDVHALSRLLDTHRPGLVINAAGISQGSQAELFRINGQYAAQVASCCSRAGVTFVFISSSRVFGTQLAPVRTEEVIPQPTDDYGRSKFRGEERVRALGDHYIVRLPMILGYRSRHPETQIVNRLIERGRAGLPVQVSVDVLHSPLHVSQAVAAVLALVDSSAEPGTYHVTGAEMVTLKTLMERVFHGLNFKVPVKGVGAVRFAADPILDLTLTSSKLLPAGGWKEAVDHLVADYLLDR